MFNPITPRDRVEASPVWATLTNLETGEPLAFWMNPESQREDYGVKVKALGALGTGDPLLCYQHSQRKLTLPQVRIMAPGQASDISPLLDRLIALTRPDPQTLRPPQVSFTWGAYEVPKALLTRLRVDRKQMRSSLPTEAVVDLEITPDPDTPELASNDLGGILVLSDKERVEAQEKLIRGATPEDLEALGVEDILDIRVGQDGTLTGPDGTDRGNILDYITGKESLYGPEDTRRPAGPIDIRETAPDAT